MPTEQQTETIVTNEKDKADVELMLSAHSFPVTFTNRRTADVNQRLRDAILNLIITARREEREAVWREVIGIADKHLDEPGFGFILRNKLIEAAATKGGNDG